MRELPGVSVEVMRDLLIRVEAVSVELPHLVASCPVSPAWDEIRVILEEAFLAVDPGEGREGASSRAVSALLAARRGVAGRAAWEMMLQTLPVSTIG
ncbi:MAG TPA: hypothetical protein VMD59_08280 [Acidimicrobiales bacterium]|nr:hypothetical protein [Acidimicrobiales bacterium]